MTAEDVLSALDALLALGGAQSRALEANALTRFDELLERRSGLLQRLGLSDAADTEGVVAELTGAPESTRNAVLAALADLAALDSHHEAALASELRGILDTLPALDNGRRAAAAYRAPAVATAYVDRAS